MGRVSRRLASLGDAELIRTRCWPSAGRAASRLTAKRNRWSQLRPDGPVEPGRCHLTLDDCQMAFGPDRARVWRCRSRRIWPGGDDSSRSCHLAIAECQMEMARHDHRARHGYASGSQTGRFGVPARRLRAVRKIWHGSADGDQERRRRDLVIGRRADWRTSGWASPWG